jgi:hypothetical protein
MIGGYFARPAEHFAVLKDSVFLKAYPYFLSSAVSSLFPLAGFLVVLFGFKETSRRGCKSAAADGEETPAVAAKPNIRSLLTPQLVAILVNTALATVLLMTVNTLVPLFSYTPIKDGGLALSPRQIGLALTWLSVFRTVCQIFLFPVLHRKLGSTGVLRLAVSTYPLIAIFLPLSNVLARAHKPLAAIMVYMLAVSVPGCAFPSSADFPLCAAQHFKHDFLSIEPPGQRRHAHPRLARHGLWHQCVFSIEHPASLTPLQHKQWQLSPGCWAPSWPIRSSPSLQHTRSAATWSGSSSSSSPSSPVALRGPFGSKRRPGATGRTRRSFGSALISPRRSSHMQRLAQSRSSQHMEVLCS